jgi:hypothetical protein
MYYEAIAATFKDRAEIAAFCDLSTTRMNYANRILTERYGVPAAKTYYYTDTPILTGCLTRTIPMLSLLPV